MPANRLRVTELDFDTIKTNLKSFLQQQSEFSDYDFDGSGLSVLLDILAYNTHYNGYYLNMVANEAFLDTAILRDSAVSLAKTLGYIPYSVTSSRAVINLTIDSGTTTAETLTIPKGYVFRSSLIDNKSYNFVTLESATVTKSNTSFHFEDLNIYEGQLVTYNFNHTESSNPKAIFVLPDANIDTTTITVSVTPSAGNTEVTVYTQVTEVLDVSSTSNVYFLQEGKNGRYEIYFGDGVVGKKLSDGAIVTVTYLVTNGSAANKANGFVATTAIDGYTNFTIDIVDVASGGADRESVESIKYSARSQYATQNRLVTFKDYEAYVKRNYPSIDSLSVWGGEDETPPVYGKVYISLKPKTNYFISETEKQRIIDEIITPKAIVAVQAEIRDPEYLYLLVNNYVKYDPRKTTSSVDTIENNIRNAVISYKQTYLDKFGATFAISKFQDEIDDTNLNSIVGSETVVRVQKRFEPTINSTKNYEVVFGVSLHRGTISNKLTSTEFDVIDVSGIRRTVQFDEIPQSYSGLSSIEVTNAGSGYTAAPTITITGDGIGAEAEAVIVNGKIERINITKRGTDYTRAIVTISGGNGFGAVASAIIDARTGTLRTIYYDSNAERQIVDDNVGEIDYDNGIIYINDINILSVSSTDGLIRLSLESERGIIETNKNTIITLDEDDPSAITIELESI